MSRGVVFIAHASEQKSSARALGHKLRGRELEAFVDEDSLPPGDSFDDRIRDAIESTNVFVFLISPESMRDGKYALTELGIAKKRWPNPTGRVLPVLLAATEVRDIDPYLTQSVSFFRPKGNFETEVADAIEQLLSAQHQSKNASRLILLAAGALVLATLVAWVASTTKDPPLVGEKADSGLDPRVSASGGGNRTADGGNAIDELAGGGSSAIQTGGTGGNVSASTIAPAKPQKSPGSTPNGKLQCKEVLRDGFLVCMCGNQEKTKSLEPVSVAAVYKAGHPKTWSCP